MNWLKYIQISSIFPSIILLLGGLLFSSQLRAQTPNDPLYPQQNYLDIINIQDAWNVTTGDPNISIAIIGTGGIYDGHEDMAARVTLKTDRIGFEFGAGVTAGAGIIGAEADNSKGIAGINWNSSLLSYDIGGTHNDPDNGSFSALDETIVDKDINAAVEDGADILFMPFKMVPDTNAQEIETFSFIELPTFSREDWIDYVFELGKVWVSLMESSDYHYSNAMISMREAYKKGRTIIAPMDDYSGETKGIPTVLSRDHLVTSVGSATKNGADHFQYSSSGGSYTSPENTDIDVVAPGENVLTSLIDSSDAYSKVTTTKAAAAQVAGITSLLKSVDPNLEPNDIREILRRTAIDIEGPGYDTKTGFGLVNAKSAFDFVQNRTFTRGTATEPFYIKKIADDKDITLFKGPWGNLASGTYGVDIYEVKFKVDIPIMEDSDIWFRAKKTYGWDLANPNYERHHAFLEDFNPVEGYAIFRTYVYGDIHDSAGHNFYWEPADTNNVQLSYTIATKPISSNTDQYIIQDETISTNKSYDELYIADNVNLSISSDVTIKSDANVIAGTGASISVVDDGTLTANDADFRLGPNAEIEINTSGSVTANNVTFRSMYGSTAPEDRWKHIKLLTNNNDFSGCYITGADKGLYVASSGNTVTGGLIRDNAVGVYLSSGDATLRGVVVDQDPVNDYNVHGAVVRGSATLYTDSYPSMTAPTRFRDLARGVDIADFGRVVAYHTAFHRNDYNNYITGDGDLDNSGTTTGQGYGSYVPDANTVYDIYNLSSDVAGAQYNWWGSSTEPPADSRFYGSVSRYNPLSCDPTITGSHCEPIDDGGGCSPTEPCIAEANLQGGQQVVSGIASESKATAEQPAGPATRQKIKDYIQEVYGHIREHPGDERIAEYVEKIHDLLVLYDHDDSIREWAGFDQRLQQWQDLYVRFKILNGEVTSTDLDPGGAAEDSPLLDHRSVLTRLGQRAMLIKLNDLLHQGSPQIALELAAMYAPFIEGPDYRASLLAAQAVGWEQDRQFGQALAAYEQIESIDRRCREAPRNM